MIKLLKLIFCAFILFLIFLLGVIYSEPVKNLSNWIFETKEQEIEFEEIKENTQQQDVDQIDGNNINNIPNNSGIVTEKKEVIIEDPKQRIETKTIQEKTTDGTNIETKTIETKIIPPENSVKK